MRTLYTLLIGINDYKGQDLRQCVNDVLKVKAFLDLQSSQFDTYRPNMLVDQIANKSNIVSTLENIIAQLQDDDTFVLYFSGHGAEEYASDLFFDAWNGKIQCIVCHPDNDMFNAMLADKELRYLFSKIKSKAHVLTIFDCCHAGDITRNVKPLNNEIYTAKVAGLFPARDPNNFIFNDEDFDFDILKSRRFDEVFNTSNIVTLSACSSSELSYETVVDGGVFTKNLLEQLSYSNGLVNYGDLVKRVRYKLRSNAYRKQTPTIDVLGHQKYNHFTSWLNLNGERYYTDTGYIFYSNNIGWIYSKGRLHGIDQNAKVKVILSGNNEIEMPIIKIENDRSIVATSQEDNEYLVISETYRVIEDPVLIAPYIFINNLDDNLEIGDIVSNKLESSGLVQKTDDAHQADYFINIFNEMLYFSFDRDPYRPLNSFCPLLKEDYTVGELDAKSIYSRVQSYVDGNLTLVQKWHHLSSLSLSDQFSSPPITIELSVDDGITWRSITEQLTVLNPLDERSTNPYNPIFNKVLYKQYQLRITNNSDENLYLLPLLISKSRLTVKLIDESAGASVYLEPSKNAVFNQVAFLDHFMEVYNWEKEEFMFKFLVNNYEDQNHILTDFEQEMSEPYMFGQERASHKSKDFFSNPPRNAVYTARLELINTGYNRIAGQLKERYEEYSNDERIAPFIVQHYWEYDPRYFDLKSKVNTRGLTSEGEKGLGLDLSNFADNLLRKRKFKRIREKYPERPIIVAEGDSWFLFPFLVNDTLDHLMDKGLPIRSLAKAGDTLENFKETGQLLNEVKKLKPKYVLISGGGNDIIGPSIVKILNNKVEEGSTVDSFLNDQFDEVIQKLKDWYYYFFEEISKHDFVERIIVHGYDYIKTDQASIVVRDGWVNKHMIEKGITNADDRSRILKFLIDEFNEMLSDLASENSKGLYIDLRGVVASDQWYDEIHPNDLGFEKVAEKFYHFITS